MYSFNKYKIEKGKNFYILSCENILQYKSEDDEFKEEYLAAITPSCWDETLVSKINLNAYHIYHIYGMQMLHGCYNRIGAFFTADSRYRIRKQRIVSDNRERYHIRVSHISSPFFGIIIPVL